MPRGFWCAACGKWHDELALDYGFDEPRNLAELDADERERYATVDGDFVVIAYEDQTDRFMRGVLEIPITDADEVFRYGVWVSLSEASYDAARAAYRDQIAAGPFFGWLCNRLPNYPDTVSLATMVHVRAQFRPTIELEPTDHPLAVEQREGITMSRVEEIIAGVSH